MQVAGSTAPVAMRSPEALDEAAYRTIVDAVAQLMWVNDAGGGVRFFNRFGTSYIGRSNAELEGRAWLAYIHDDDRAPLAAARAAAIAEGRAYSVDGRFRRHDGEYRWQSFDVQPVRGSEGSILGWIGSARDVHDERLRAAEREQLLADVSAERAILRAVSEQLPAGLTIVEAPSGRILYFNGEGERLLGHPALPSTGVDEYVRYGAIHADGRPFAAHEYPTAFALSGERCELDPMVYRRGDGRIVRLHVTAAPVRDASGTITHAVCTWVDVTAQHDAERVLAERGEELRALAETMPQLVWMAGGDGRVHYFNARWMEYTGQAHEQLVAGSASHGASIGIVHPDDAPGMLARWTRATESGEAYEIVYRLRRADGAFRWFVARAAATRGDDGRVARWFGSCTDIHDEVLVRERLQRLNGITERLAEARDVATISRIVAAEGIAALGASASRLALLREDGITLDLHGVQDVPEDISAKWRSFPVDTAAPLPTVVRTGEPLYLTTLAEAVARFPLAADELTRLRYGAVAVLPLEWSGRRLGGVSFAFEEPRAFDADSRTFLETLARQCAQALERARLFALEQRAREEAEAARAEAQRANVAKGQFLAMMSHDLRTPINATLGYAELMVMGIRGPLTAEQRHDLERVQRSQRALLALVNEVLDYTRVEAGRADCRRDPLALRDVLADVAAIVETLAEGTGLLLEVAPAPDAIAMGDRDRVRQVLLNLLTNAVKFTAPGGTVRLTSTVDATSVRVHVADTGRGIARDRLASVFEPFVQVHASPDPTARAGVGLGLAIARELARAMEGTLTAESVVGEGSVFTLELPRG